MQKAKKQKEKTTIDNNPFDNWFFWLSLATADFPFVLFENSMESEPKPKKQMAEETEDIKTPET